ncbi:Atlastin [Operophtera brumata]|uniref:Atlastin n=1 Tax=Operophtera brumata TaxID=104452 RepID=A0A0L7LAL9_OPEBR|nr:Atlastin [Operophtera brumata]
MVFYVASGVFGLVGLYPIANLCNLAMGFALITLVMWAYIRYSGEMREFGVTIDDCANTCLEKGMEHAAAAAAERALGPPTPTANGKHKHL